MLFVDKINLFFTCGEAADLSSLSSVSQIDMVCRVSPTGQSIQIWTPSVNFPSFSELSPGVTYYLKSKSASYQLDVVSEVAAQNSSVTGKYQFFTYTGASSRSLASLSNKSKITKIYKVSTNGLSVQAWTPSLSFPLFNTFAPSNSYLVVSNTYPYELLA
jgi:hypothetical protein